jgi:hypothetical protein
VERRILKLAVIVPALVFMALLGLWQIYIWLPDDHHSPGGFGTLFRDLATVLTMPVQLVLAGAIAGLLLPSRGARLGWVLAALFLLSAMMWVGPVATHTALECGREMSQSPTWPAYSSTRGYLLTTVVVAGFAPFGVMLGLSRRRPFVLLVAVLLFFGAMAADIGLVALLLETCRPY